MIRNPLQTGCREHEVHVAAGSPLTNVAVLESHVVGRVLHCLVEHRLGVVDTDHLVDAQLLCGERCQFPGPQPRSAARSIEPGSIRASRSWNG